MDKEQFKKVCQKLDSYREDMIKFQAEITAIPALSPKSGGDGEWKKARVIEKYLRDFGADSIDIVEAADPDAENGSRPSLLAKIKGQDSSRTVWVMAHLDVVPVVDEKAWDSEPWKVTEKDGKIYGRGVEDNQQGMTGSLFVMRAFKELGIKPTYDYGLAFVADEETGSEFGIPVVIEKTKAFKKEDLVVVPDMGNPEGSIIEIAEKNILWVNFLLKGVQTHASTPGNGKNAHLAGADLIMRLYKNLHQKFDKSNKLFDPPISTFSPTKKDSNVPNINTIPGEDKFSFDCRIMPEYTIDEVKAEIDKHVAAIEEEHGVKISQDFPQQQASSVTSEEAPVVKAIVNAVKDVYNVTAKPVGVGGGTVAAFFRFAGIPAACWGKLDETMHGPNEYCVIDNMIGDAKVFAHVALQK